MSIYLTQTDLDERLLSSKCCFGNLAYKTNKEFRYGLKCANKHLEDMFLINVFIEMLDCYTPLDPLNPDETNNCISEKQAQYIFEQLSKKCKTCFESINNTYE